MFNGMKRGFAMVTALLLGAVAVWAHDPGLSTAQGRISADAIEIAAGFSPTDVQALLPAAFRAKGKWTQEEFDAARKPLEGLAGRLWEVRVGGSPIAAREVSVDWIAGDNLSFRAVYPWRGEGRVVFRAVQLEKLPSGHREFVTFEDEIGRLVARKLLSAKSNEIEFAAPQRTGTAVATAEANTKARGAATFWGFLALGFEHIWTGYDHLLFLFGLLIVCRSFRSIFTIVSCFTLAHSITLSLATLGWINLPGRLVEPAIAASIVFVGVENLLRRGAEPRGRWALTFGFGLIHGLGFASVLCDLGVGQDGQGLAVPLLSFNLGVEVGQVLVAAIVLPVFWRLRKNDAFALRGVPILSVVVTVLGAWWLVERTVL